MVDGIFAFRGTVDKFISDKVMANSGTLKLVGNDVLNAFNCALEMNLKLNKFKKFRKERL
tara:strand:- start:269 stop:448 length:180 start_codon:yes stop_codon:yes gene_type:complete